VPPATGVTPIPTGQSSTQAPGLPPVATTKSGPSAAPTLPAAQTVPVTAPAPPSVPVHYNPVQPGTEALAPPVVIPPLMAPRPQ
jgi:hypothetical protein